MNDEAIKINEPDEKETAHPSAADFLKMTREVGALDGSGVGVLVDIQSVAGITFNRKVVPCGAFTVADALEAVQHDIHFWLPWYDAGTVTRLVDGQQLVVAEWWSASDFEEEDIAGESEIERVTVEGAGGGPDRPLDLPVPQDPRGRGGYFSVRVYRGRASEFVS